MYKQKKNIIVANLKKNYVVNLALKINPDLKGLILNTQWYGGTA